jgi:hypothetical protein
VFEFHRDGKVQSVKEAMAFYKGKCHSGELEGSGRAERAFEMVYKKKTLRGEAIVAQCTAWAAAGTMEPDAAQAIISVARKGPQEMEQLFKDHVFVLLGAAAAMGPFLTLMALGATVVALDISGKERWARLLGVAQKSGGKITFPLAKPQSECPTFDDLAANAGVDLTRDAPEIANWLCSVYPDKRLVIGSYVYLDSAFFVKVSVACDAIIARVLEQRKNTAIAMLGTPTDV